MEFDGYKIARYRPEFKKQIAQLQTELWSSDVELNAAYFEWKHERNPYSREPLVYVALSEGQVVGMIGLVPTKWEVGNPKRTLFALAACDTTIDPAHRNRALFTRMFDVAIRDLATSAFEFMYCMSASRISRLSLLMTGWQNVGSLEWGLWQPFPRIRRLARRVPVLKAVRASVEGIQLSPADLTRRRAADRGPFEGLDRNAVRQTHKFREHISVSRTPRVDAMEALVKRSRTDDRYRFTRDRDYFAWRFKNPRSRYRFLYWDDEVLQGYLVLEWSTDLQGKQGRHVRILDWQAANSGVLVDMVQATINRGNFPVLTIWSVTLEDDTKKALGNAGFAFMDQEEARRREQYVEALLVKPIRAEAGAVDTASVNRSWSDMANWDLRQSFSDDH